jgi:hypothetical protein
MKTLKDEEAKQFAENIRLRNLQRSQEILQQRKEEARGVVGGRGSIRMLEVA